MLLFETVGAMMDPLTSISNAVTSHVCPVGSALGGLLVGTAVALSRSSSNSSIPSKMDELKEKAKTCTVVAAGVREGMARFIESDTMAAFFKAEKGNTTGSSIPKDMRLLKCNDDDLIGFGNLIYTYSWISSISSDDVMTELGFSKRRPRWESMKCKEGYERFIAPSDKGLKVDTVTLLKAVWPNFSWPDSGITGKFLKWNRYFQPFAQEAVRFIEKATADHKGGCPEEGNGFQTRHGLQW